MFPVRYGPITYYVKVYLGVPCASNNKQWLSPNIINRLGCVEETYCVSCEVRTEYLNYVEAYLCVPYGSHNEQRLFRRTELTRWSL
jgi:hypothetical protein